MNPLLYKAHPLLSLTLDVLANPAAHPLNESIRLILIYLAVNLAWAPFLWWCVKKGEGFAPHFALAYCLALPATLFYLPPMLTVLGDVLGHEFHFSDRFILAFTVFIASQMLSAFYGLAVRQPNTGKAIGLVSGLSISLCMWLASLPIGLLFLWVESYWKML